jgi:hypothetical protein
MASFPFLSCPSPFEFIKVYKDGEDREEAE